jgi:hypothetical protein
MGEARRRNALKLDLAPRTAQAPIRVRQITLYLPVELVERLEKLCPPKWPLHEWLVGALAAFAGLAEEEKRRSDSPLVLPYRNMPNVPPGPPNPPPHIGPRQWA